MLYSTIVGLNYRGTTAELGGCENDSLQYNYLIQRIGGRSTVFNSIQAIDLRNEFKKAEALTANDTFYFIYSGHGTQIESKLETDENIEALVLHSAIQKESFELFTDKELTQALNRMVCRKVVIFDSCFSGGMDKLFLGEQGNRKFLPYKSIEQNAKIIREVSETSVTKQTNKSKTAYLFASKENQTSIDLGANGAFSGALFKHINNERDISKLMKLITADIRKYQTPRTVYKNTKSFQIFSL